MIVVDKVTKKYGRKKVLDEVSFKIDGGEFVSIVGASGAGKTTLIHSMIGGAPVSSGRILVDDYDVTRLRPSKTQEYRRRIVIVFQDYKLLPQKTVYENVAFALEVAGSPKKIVSERTISVLKLTGLEEQRNSFPRQLSGGENQRTAVARALVHAPDLLIADEPTGNLDPENAKALAKLLLQINKHGTTVILATHNKDIVDTIKRRVITLKKGKMVSDKRGASYN